MEIDQAQLNIIHDPERDVFEIRYENYVSVLNYSVLHNLMTITHTGVPPELEGQGIASRLTHAALEYARAQNYRVFPLCSFAAAYIRRHPEYKSLLK